MTDTDWKNLLATPGPNSHIVQIYQDEQFLSEASSHFAAEGLVRGESIILTATHSSWLNISTLLRNKGFLIQELIDRGQLTLLNAENTLVKFMINGMPDGRIFKSLYRESIQKARRDGKYPAVRWWGEGVNLLYVEGNEKAANKIEEYVNELVHEESMAIFCSYMMDKYDPHIYDESLSTVCTTHSNLIPTHDYSAHNEAVNKAITEVLGPIKGPLLHSLTSWESDSCGIPSSQAKLLWVKNIMPGKFGDVLQRAKLHDRSACISGSSQ